jgi:hypothetical protein
VATWAEFEGASFELSVFGYQHLNDRVAYLGTVRSDGAPRVRPVTPRIRHGRLFIRMDRGSPKIADLKRDSRYSLHSLVTDTTGDQEEFAISGRASAIEDPQLVAELETGMTNMGQFPLFEFAIEEAMSTVYGDDGAIRHRWRSPTQPA